MGLTLLLHNSIIRKLMADNYLERKMEEHRAGKTHSVSRRLSPSGARPGTLTVKFPPRRVFVTGGAAGIGRAIVTAFRNAGCRVAFCDTDSKAGTATAQATGAQFHPCDVTDADALTATVNRLLHDWGDIDIVINNVGISDFNPLTETDTDRFDRVIDTNLRPAFITSRLLASHRSAAGASPAYGRIINISSTRALQSEPSTEAYSASKGGICALSHALMMSVAPLGITVNTILPGWIETGDYSTLTEADHRQHPSGRVGRPDDIARICLFLACPDNDFINGAEIVADGGMTRRMIYV